MEIIFNKINQLPILDVLDSFNIWYKKVWQGYNIVKPDWKTDSSFSISTKLNLATDFWKSWVSWSPFDLIWRFHNLDTQTAEWRVATIKLFVDKWLVENQQQQTDFVKSLSWQELLDNYESHKLGWYKQELSRFLITRWFTYEWIQKNQLRIWETFADIWFYENYFTTEKSTFQDENWKRCNQEWDRPKTVPILLFPCYDDQWTLIGLKLRRIDGKTIRWNKSLAVGKTGLLYNSVATDKMIIVEGETDYLVLKLLWYENVVWNLGWVQALRPQLKSLLSGTTNIICLYDNDTAWTNGKLALQETFKRQIQEIIYPIRKNEKWVLLSDVNDYFNVWFNSKKKLDELLSGAVNIWEKEWIEHLTDFIFLRSTLEYYDIKYKTIQKEWSVSTYLWCTKKELAAKVQSRIIKQFEWLCYLEWWKQGYYNTLDESIILKNSWDTEPFLHEHIEKLVNNIWGHKKKNIEWINKSILYKLTHINDPYVPALILYGAWWSWKGTLLNLLSKIFWEDNLQTWLWQKDLEWNFDSYQWNKLIVEYKEVSSWNKFQDKKVTDKIKSIINEKEISVRALYQNARKVHNIARFHFSSNHAVPLQLDSKDSGNRRFSIIKTWNKLDPVIAREMNEVTFKDKEIIKGYIGWLYETFPDIPKANTLVALENSEKKNLEMNCEGAWNLFFNWVEQHYPHILKITNLEKNKLLRMYCEENWEDINDARFQQKNFDNWLSHRYEKKNISIRWRTSFGYQIMKTDYEKIESIDNTFKKNEVDNFIIW